MILYNVWFSFKPGFDEAAELSKTRLFLDDLKNRSSLHHYRLMKNRGTRETSKLPPYQLMAEFQNDGQFKLPFAEVARIGIHSGKHGAMIDNVGDFVVEIFEDLQP